LLCSMNEANIQKEDLQDSNLSLEEKLGKSKEACIFARDDLTSTIIGLGRELDDMKEEHEKGLMDLRSKLDVSSVLSSEKDLQIANLKQNNSGLSELLKCASECIEDLKSEKLRVEVELSDLLSASDGISALNAYSEFRLKEHVNTISGLHAEIESMRRSWRTIELGHLEKKSFKIH